jgi:superfamily II DNA helicase RecQ
MDYVQGVYHPFISYILLLTITAEAGRAGRDGAPAHCILFASATDICSMLVRASDTVFAKKEGESCTLFTVMGVFVTLCSCIYGSLCSGGPAVQHSLHHKVCKTVYATQNMTDNCYRAMADPDMGVYPAVACQQCQNCLCAADTAILHIPINLVTWQIYKVLHHLAQQGSYQTPKQLARLIRKLNKGAKDPLFDGLRTHRLGREPQQLLLSEVVSTACSHRLGLCTHWVQRLEELIVKLVLQNALILKAAPSSSYHSHVLLDSNTLPQIQLSLADIMAQEQHWASFLLTTAEQSAQAKAKAAAVVSFISACACEHPIWYKAAQIEGLQQNIVADSAQAIDSDMDLIDLTVGEHGDKDDPIDLTWDLDEEMDVSGWMDESLPPKKAKHYVIEWWKYEGTTWV